MDIYLASTKLPSLFTQLAEFLDQGKNVALIILLETRGSTPQVAGAKALITLEGLAAGTIGGGFFEAAIIEIAQKWLKLKRAELINWNFAADLAEEGSVCGGQALVLVDGNPQKNHQVFKEVGGSLKQRRRGLLSILIEKTTSDQISLDYFFLPEGEVLANLIKNKVQSKEVWSFISKEEMADFFKDEKPRLIKGRTAEGREEILFIEPIYPLPRLLVFGAGHVGQAVARLGLFLGFEVFLFDDRADLELPIELRSKVNFIAADMASSLEKFPLDKTSYLIIVTRGHRYDAEVLRVGLKKEFAYIGMIGSRRKVALMREEFLKKGWAKEEDWAKLHSPIGLDLGAKTVEEIALSIMAEVVACRRQSRKEDG
ncbi:MAG: XdhC family protein [Candidatus Aminicenantes bacterium]|nr:XdhC family protein [Candidatus Aminicenantes bacterium]